MHRHECNTHIEPIYFYSKNQTMTFFSYTRFPVNKINVEKIFKIMRKFLCNYSFYSHPEIGNFRVWQATWWRWGRSEELHRVVLEAVRGRVVGPGCGWSGAQRARHGGPSVQALQAAALLLVCVLLCACRRSQETNCCCVHHRVSCLCASKTSTTRRRRRLWCTTCT
jgi:hypothetical protein